MTEYNICVYKGVQVVVDETGLFSCTVNDKFLYQNNLIELQKLIDYEISNDIKLNIKALTLQLTECTIIGISYQCPEYTTVFVEDKNQHIPFSVNLEYLFKYDKIKIEEINKLMREINIMQNEIFEIKKSMKFSIDNLK